MVTKRLVGVRVSSPPDFDLTAPSVLGRGQPRIMRGLRYEQVNGRAVIVKVLLVEAPVLLSQFMHAPRLPV